jgi:glucose uptake protein
LLLALFLAFTLGSAGSVGRSFLADLGQASGSSIVSALFGGIIFNLANILLVAAIDIAGMAVAFPIGIGIALVLGVFANYVATPVGNPQLLFGGVAAITLAIILDAIAYRRLASRGQKTTAKGIVISIAAGLLMGFFYRFVAASMSSNFANLQAGMLSPYTAVVVFSSGLFLSNFLWNTLVMVKPFVGEPVPIGDYFSKGNVKLHLIGILGGVIWSLGMSLSIIAFGAAGPAISYGLGQGATMVAACWGVFVWKEFQSAPGGTNKLLAMMFASFVVGLSLIIVARIV